jgi:hypothetical protein
VCNTHFATEGDRSGVRVQLRGAATGPLLVLVETDDPLAAHSVDQLAGAADLFIPLDSPPTAGTRVSVVGTDGDATAVLCTADVAPDPQQAVQVSLAPPSDDIWPGRTSIVKVACRTGSRLPRGATLIARLIDATGAGFADWQPGRRPPEPPAPSRNVVVTSSRDTGAPASQPAEPPPATTRSTPTNEILLGALSGPETLWSTAVEITADVTDLPVPLPTTPGVYRLIAVVCTPDGRMASDMTLLDARRGVRVALDVPARLTLGDRTIVAARLENGYPQAAPVQVQLATGDGLAVESVWYISPAGEKVRSKPGEALEINLPGSGYVWAYADVEAARVGADRVAMAVTAQGATHAAERVYEVLSTNAPAETDAPVSIQRTVLLGTVIEEPPSEEHEHLHPTWRWDELSPQDRLVPGQLLRVDEKVVSNKPLAGLRWSQRLPTTCAMVRGEPRPVETIGSRESGRADVMTFRATEVKAGEHLHAYYLAVIRPGACVLPLPELRVGDERIPVHVEPADLRVIVAGGP